MKWLVTLAALALFQLSAAGSHLHVLLQTGEGRKLARSTELLSSSSGRTADHLVQLARYFRKPPSASSADDDVPLHPVAEVEAENDELKKKNKHLEAMMQVARGEVHRMDLAIKSKKASGSGSDAEDVERLHLQLDKAKATEKKLSQTLRQLLAKNSTTIFRTQADRATKAERAAEEKYAKEREALQARLKEANGKFAESKDLTQTLQEQNMDLQKSVQSLRGKLATSEKKDKDLTTDKANLVETMRSLMRDTTKGKKDLQVEKEQVQRDVKELAEVKAKLAKLTKPKKIPKLAAAKQAGKSASKNTTLKMEHEESMASKMAKMHDINRYMDRLAVPADDGEDAPEQANAPMVAPTAAPKASDWLSVTKQVDSLAKQEDVFEKNKLQNHASDSPQDVADAAAMAHQTPGLSNWLGLKVKPTEGAVSKDANGLSPIDALDPEAVKQEKLAQAQKAKEDADDGGDGIENLLSQAKDQLNAMDNAEVQGPKSDQLP